MHVENIVYCKQEDKQDVRFTLGCNHHLMQGLSMLSAVEADPSSRVSLYDNTGHLETSDNNQNEDRWVHVDAPHR